MSGKQVDTKFLMARYFVNCEPKKRNNKKVTSDCWVYRTNTSTYTSVKLPEGVQKYFGTKTTMLHRLIYALWNDTPLDQKDIIMHICDNRCCINPHHLKLGTHKENCWLNNL